jgi:glycine/D-amino acid oxidase-like deaminating enzyme
MIKSSTLVCSTISTPRLRTSTLSALNNLGLRTCEGHYIIPRKDGQLLIGSTMEDVGFDRSTDKQVGDAL